MNPAIAILGGSFDPVHAAHVEIARRALLQIPCDEVWFMPAARAVHKPDGAQADAGHRRAMLELAIGSERGLSICDLEIARGVPMRSLESLTELVARWSGRRWFLLLGEDSFRALDSWYRPEELLRIAAPVVAPRPGSEGDRPQSWRGIAVRWLEGGGIDLDSTAIRRELASGGVPGGLDPLVLRYIHEHGLYREQPG